MLRLMEEYEPLVNNSVAFAEQLSNDLHVLDEVRGARAVIQQKNGAWRGGALDQVTGHHQSFHVLEALGLKDVLVQCCFIPKEISPRSQEATAAPLLRVNGGPTMPVAGRV